MNVRVVMLCIGIVSLISCQKEYSIEKNKLPPTTPQGNGELILKIHEVQNTDTLTTSYDYDSQNRLIAKTWKGVRKGVQYDEVVRYYRDTYGRVVKIAVIDNESTVFNDTVYTVLHYANTAAKFYDYKITASPLGMGLIKDSVQAIYVSNKIAAEEHYQLGFGISKLTGAVEYEYNGAGDLLLLKYFEADDNGSLELTESYDFVYDTKTAALNATDDMLNILPGISKHNALTMNYSSVSNSADNFLRSFTYTYNTKGRPATALSQQTPANGKTEYIYIYK